MRSRTDRVYLPREGLDAVPIYHERGRYEGEYGDPARPSQRTGDRLYTACGILVYRYTTEGGTRVDRTALRRDHAATFATPCQRCDRVEQAEARWQSERS